MASQAQAQAKQPKGAAPASNPSDRSSLASELFALLEVIATEDYLDLAGFVHNYHSLNTIQLYGRKILPVDDFALHLIWKEEPSIHLIKALPDALFNADGTLIDEWESLHLLERSLLYSYLQLIRGRRDLDIASDDRLSLVPETFRGKEGWQRWETLCRSINTHIEPLNHSSIQRLAQDVTLPNPFDGKMLSPSRLNSIHVRYWYGDLRLTRLNLIALWWRLLLWLPWEQNKRVARLAHRGHFFHTRNPVSTFWTGFGIYIVLIFAYLTTVLTAMQVALGAPPTPSTPEAPNSNPDWFSNTCRYFSYVVILAIVIQVPLAMVYIVFVILSTLIGWRRKTTRNPAIVSIHPRISTVSRRDTEMGKSVDSDQVIKSVGSDQAMPGAYRE